MSIGLFYPERKDLEKKEKEKKKKMNLMTHVVQYNNYKLLPINMGKVPSNEELHQSIQNKDQT